MGTERKIFTLVKEYLFITFGVIMFALGWTVFLMPNNLIGGGVTGIGSIVQYATGGAVKIGYVFFVLNLGLLVLALSTLGKNFGAKTVYAILLDSIALVLLPELIPAEFTQSIAVDNGKLMSTIMGGIVVGTGIGITFNSGGSSGGTDIIALVVNKYRGVSPGRMILAIDVIIMVSSLFFPSYTPSGTLLPFTEKLVTVVYGLILTTITSTVIDLVMEGSKKSVQLFILSSKYEQIADAITKDFHRGVTALSGQGWYTRSGTQVLMVLIPKKDLPQLLRCIKNIDSDAFLSISSVSGVYGKGFDTIRQRRKKNLQ
ncbi:MAG: YitT family protein [Bacteroidales bacterium]|nr:YitT family protein [Bacteroidales bacterium]